MPRYLLTIQYDGTPYVGWQQQKNNKSIQETLENAIQQVLQHPIELYASGRTDKGVHAFGQKAHFDSPKILGNHRLQQAINFYLINKAIAISNVSVVPVSFHARFSCLERQYIYKIRIANYPSVLEENRYWELKYNLDISLMQKATKYLLGTHDFNSFRSSHCQAKSSIRSIDTIVISENILSPDERHIYLYFQARSFLHHQVRNMVGTLYEIGRNKIKPQYIQTILQARDRTKAGQTAPACGLYFLNAIY